MRGGTGTCTVDLVLCGVGKDEESIWSYYSGSVRVIRSRFRHLGWYLGELDRWLTMKVSRAVKRDAIRPWVPL